MKKKKCVYNKMYYALKYDFERVSDTILGEDYCIVDPVSGMQANDIMADDIINKYESINKELKLNKRIVYILSIIIVILTMTTLTFFMGFMTICN